MRTRKQWIKVFSCKCFLMLLFFVLLSSQPAFADLVSGMEELQSKVKSICPPVAGIFLVIAGWQKCMGNSQLFVAALVGTGIMFAAPMLVDFISLSFGR